MGDHKEWGDHLYESGQTADDGLSGVGSMKAPRKSKELLLADYNEYTATGFRPGEPLIQQRAAKGQRAGAQAIESYFGADANRRALSQQWGAGEQTDRGLDKLAAVGELGAKTYSDAAVWADQMAAYKSANFRAALERQQDRARDNATFWNTEGATATVDNAGAAMDLAGGATAEP